MLSRRYRLADRRVIARLHRQGQEARTENLIVKLQPNQRQLNRVAVVVSTKVSKLATQRNSMRRRLFGAVEELWEQLSPGNDLLIIARRDIGILKPQQLREQLALTLKRLRVFRARDQLS